MFELPGDASASSERIAAAVRAYAEVRAALGDGADPGLTGELVGAGGHLWQALARERRFAEIEVVAADMSERVARSEDVRVGRAWSTAVDSLLPRLPAEARRRLVARSERLAERFGPPFAAALIHSVGEAVVVSVGGGADALRDDIAELRRLAGTNATRLAVFAETLARVAETLGLLAVQDSRADTALRAIVDELARLAGAADALARAREALPENQAAERERLRAEALARREQDPLGSRIEATLRAAGFAPPEGPVPDDALDGRVAWFAFDRRGWLLQFDAETGFAPHSEHGALLQAIAARLGRAITVEEDGFVAGRGWRLVFSAPERHVLESPREEPDDWVDVDLLYRAVQVVAGEVPVHELRTGDQTVTLLLAPADAVRALERDGLLKALKARAIGGRKRAKSPRAR